MKTTHKSWIAGTCKNEAARAHRKIAKNEQSVLPPRSYRKSQLFPQKRKIKELIEINREKWKNRTKSCFIEKINNIDEFLQVWSRGKRHKWYQERGNLLNLTKIYDMNWNCESLWTMHLTTWWKMGEIFEIHSFIKLTQNTRCLEWPLKESESVITNFTPTECQRPDGFISKFY